MDKSSNLWNKQRKRTDGHDHMADGSEERHSEQEGKVDRRVLRTQAAIHEAFFKLIRERGLQKVTVSSLAREANIDRKTFYLHYESIDDLLDQIVSQFLNRILAAVDMDAFRTDPRAQIHAALDEVNVIIIENRDLCEYIASKLSIDFSIQHIGRAFIRMMGDRTLQENTWERERITYLLRFNLVGAISVYVSWLRSDHHTPLDKIADLLSDALTVSYVSMVSPVNESR